MAEQHRSKTAQPSKTYQPADLAAIGDMVVRYLMELRTHAHNNVASAYAGDPTTASTQVTGAGNTTWRIDLMGDVVVVDGVAWDLPETDDFSIHSGSNLLANGQSIVAAIGVKNVAGSLSVVAVKGTAATTGQQRAPSQAAIQAAVGAGIEWVKLAECSLSRTGDTTLVQTQDNTKRPLLAVLLPEL